MEDVINSTVEYHYILIELESEAFLESFSRSLGYDKLTLSRSLGTSNYLFLLYENIGYISRNFPNFSFKWRDLNSEPYPYYSTSPIIFLDKKVFKEYLSILDLFNANLKDYINTNNIPTITPEDLKLIRDTKNS